MPDPTGNMVATANYYEGQDYGEASPPVMNKLTQALSAIFVNPTTTVPGADLMPATGSPLIGKADPATAPPVDFDLTPRPMASPDVGAYQRNGAPSDAGTDGGAGGHWPLGLGFKGSEAMGGIPDAGGPGVGGSSGAGGSGGASQRHGCGCGVAGDSAGDDVAGLALIALLSLVLRRARGI
jgi:MYXO-CTERM domain-containing protein